MDGMDRKIEKKNKFLSKKTLWIFLGALFVILIAYRLVFGDKSSKLNVDVEKITIETVKRDVFQDYIAVIGTVEPIRTIYLDAIEGGRVEELMNEEGEMLEEGDPILQLSNTNLVLEISNNEAQVARAVNELRTARLLMVQQQLSYESQIIQTERELAQQERAYEKNKILYQQDHISEEEFKQSKEAYLASQRTLKLLEKIRVQDSIFREVQVRALEESVESMTENLKIVKSKLKNLTVRAPVAGELASLNPEVGEVITYGTRVGIINDLTAYKLRVEIDEHYIARVTTGLYGEMDFAGRSYKGKIVKIYPEVENGRFAVDMEFVNEIPDQIRIGQTSRIRLELGESKEAILIPRGGFYQSTGGQWVYVVDESGEFAEKRNISIGRQNPRYYEVLDGLVPGEKVITSSYDNFGDVDKLMLKY